MLDFFGLSDCSTTPRTPRRPGWADGKSQSRQLTHPRAATCRGCPCATVLEALGRGCRCNIRVRPRSRSPGRARQ